MKSPDLDKERSEKRLTLAEFLSAYNKDLPQGFPPATTIFLKQFKAEYPALFKNGDTWSLDQHRKKFMDWRPQRMSAVA